MHPRRPLPIRPILLQALLLLAAVAACRFPLDFLQASGGVLFQDDFASPASGWRQHVSPQAELGYQAGAYRMALMQPNLRTWAVPRLWFTDVVVSVESLRFSGSDQNAYGILCRFQDAANYYALLISSDGYYGIFRNLQGGWQQLDADGMQPTELIRQESLMNLVQAECVGSRLRLSVNGSLLAEVEDASFPQGDAGLLAGTLESENVELYFDNYSVLKP